jgi:SpoVK/Ycf46/Vps4 family AAA+-type ATPase
MIAGMPGCGKSLAARSVAALFDMPLIKLDIGKLTGKHAVESEENIIMALKLIDIISPCVLWIDEIDKVFSAKGNGDETSFVAERMLHRFYIWLHEKKNTAYIIATANDISNIPREFLRKGCFDELFFADLPDDNERRRILSIHLSKRNKLTKDISLPKIAFETEGLSGEDLESLVKEAIETAFADGQRKVTTTDILLARSNNKSVTELMKDELELLDKMRKEKNFKFANDRIQKSRIKADKSSDKQLSKISDSPASKSSDSLEAQAAPSTKSKKPSNDMILQTLALMKDSDLDDSELNGAIEKLS